MASERVNESCELKLHPQRHITANATEEIKLDGYRALAVKSEGKLNLFSRRRNSFNTQYKLVFEPLADLPDNTVIDGEVVALNGSCPWPITQLGKITRFFGF